MKSSLLVKFVQIMQIVVQERQCRDGLDKHLQWQHFRSNLGAE